MKIRKRDCNFGDLEGIVKKFADFPQFGSGVQANVISEQEGEELVEFNRLGGVVKG